MKTIKGPGIFLAQFAGDNAPFNSLKTIADWVAGLGYKGVQIPSWDARLFDLEKAATSQTYCDEIKGMLAGRGWPVPGLLLGAASLFQLLAGLGLGFGVLRPWAALGLAGFTVLASLTLLDFWRATGPDRVAMKGQFLVNTGLLGGLLLAAAASF